MSDSSHSVCLRLHSRHGAVHARLGARDSAKPHSPEMNTLGSRRRAAPAAADEAGRPTPFQLDPARCSRCTSALSCDRGADGAFTTAYIGSLVQKEEGRVLSG
jgi:hypothetical protein